MSNYVAMSATHISCMITSPDDTAEMANGTIIPGNGLTFKSLIDGTSKTIVACETREALFDPRDQRRAGRDIFVLGGEL